MKNFSPLVRISPVFFPYLDSHLYIFLGENIFFLKNKIPKTVNITGDLIEKILGLADRNF
jgi:hypothetical protein